ncbi:copper chaperone PCu(A)C [Castellaniella hirudinis]|uniref:Copper chaperone PCu(A)C n=1 Tax=Castellaniella hirudinis TaxID=1144617 RepID=A0ABV8RV12_9BURK
MNHSLKCLMVAVLAAAASFSVQARSGHEGHGNSHASHDGFGDPAKAVAPEGVTVTDCWIRALPNRLPSAAYFTLNNAGTQDAVLIGAQSSAFGKVMLHANKTVNGMAAMVHADKVVVPAGGHFEFSPGGHHVMLEQPTADLQIGKRLPITFWFESDQAITSDCDIRSPAGLK